MRFFTFPNLIFTELFYSTMNSELRRLATFSKFSGNATVSPLALARFGFFYCGQRDEIECFSCKLHLSNWERSENPDERHKNCSPLCKLVLKTDVENRPLKSPRLILDGVGASTEAIDNDQVGGLGVLTTLLKTARQRAIANGVFLNSNIDRSKPDYELLRNEEERLRTFYDWPSVAHADPPILAREGLFYTGSDDRVQCVFCRGYLSNWKPKDVPAAEHRRLFPNCPFGFKQNFGNVPIRKVNTAAVDMLGGGRHGKENEERFTEEILRPERNVILANIGSYRLEPREVKARMDTPTVRAILNMGYSRDKVKAVIETRLSTTGDDFPNAEILLEALWLLEETTSTVSTGVASSVLGSEAVNSSMFNNSSPPHVTVSPNHCGKRKRNRKKKSGASTGNNAISMDVGADPVEGLKAEGAANVEENLKFGKFFDDDDPPKYPEYSGISQRIRSFVEGPLPLSLRAKEFANAGWYYVGPGDKVRCFQCGENLKGWEREDDPWKEHIRWYKHCSYIKTHKPSERPQDLETQRPMNR